ncbi:MAG TPA: polysaccharide biosynthesis/export family protein [Acetobacteraceae bacterium]|nr:polysaccharide biosynthesis/export family protein [Acetobacteraceae bacterium]
MSCSATSLSTDETRPVDRARIYVPLALVAAALVGCAGPASDLPALPSAPVGHYILGPGDTVRVITFDAEQLTGEFRVGDGGDISVPLLGNVHAAGMSTRQLGARLTAALVHTGMFKQPSVAVEVARYRPIFILGEVKKPGQYPFQPGMTVLTAVAIGGGFTYRAIKSAFSVVRIVSGRSIEGRAVRRTPLAPGDVITVYERHF